MARVFLSHAGEDRAVADRLYGWVHAAGHEVFLAEHPTTGIDPGERWEERLHERLRWADAVVCVVTDAFVGSMWCTVEITTARARGCRIIPVLAEPGVGHALLTSLHHVDLTAADAEARTQIVEALRRLDAAGGRGWPDGKSPFPGLEAFQRDDHLAFFGRAAETAQLAALLRASTSGTERAVQLVVGPSGCGKSSLVRAGLLPVMADEPGWTVLEPVVPGREPRAALARRLAAAAGALGLGWTWSDVRRRLDDDGLVGLADDLLLAAPVARERRLLMVVDQFEELVTQTAPDERAEFARLLHAALAGPVHVVATMRPEFLDRLLNSDELAKLPTAAYTIRPLRGEALRDVIVKPAELAGLTVDDDLVTTLLTDTGSGEALPLLAFTLSQLASGVERGGRLSRDRYEQIGGVDGSLARQADAALGEAVDVAGRTRDEVLRELLRLVTVDEQRRPVSWPVDRADLGEPAAVELACFVKRRLLVTDTKIVTDTTKVIATATGTDTTTVTDPENAGTVVGVAHEAFLSAWPPLVAAINNARSALPTGRAVEQAADEWVAAGRPKERLWERGRLAAALADVGARLHRSPGARRPFAWWRGRLLTADRIELSDDAAAFLAASRRHDRWRRRRSTAVLSALLVLALAGGLLAAQQAATASAQRDLAVHNQVVSQADRLGTVDLALAAQLDLVAQRMRPTPEVETALVTSANTPLATAIDGHTDSVRGVAVTGDGRLLASISDDRTVRLWRLDVTSGAVPTGRIDLDVNPDAVAVSPDGRLLAVGEDDGAIRLWTLADPAAPAPAGPPLSGHTDYVGALAFAPDGRTLASGSGDDQVRLWNVADPAGAAPLGPPLAGHAKNVNTVTFRADGRVLASGSSDGTVRLWNVARGSDVRPLGGPLANGDYFVIAAGFSPDGRVLATGSGDRSVRLWDVADPARPAMIGQPLTGHTDFVNAVAFSPDGATLATGSGDNTVRLWNVADPAATVPLDRPLPTRATVLAVAFAPDGRSLVSAGHDSELLRWDLPDVLRTGAAGYVQKYSHALAYSPRGDVLATGTGSGSLQLWDTRDPDRPRPLPTPPPGQSAYISAVAFRPDGRLLASGSDDGTVALWNLADPTRTVRVGEPLTGLLDGVWSVTFSPDGRTVAAGDTEGGLRLWRVDDDGVATPLGDRVEAHEGAVNGVVFNPDGTLLASGSSDRTLRLWTVAGPAGLTPLAGPLTAHTGFLNALAWSPDGRTLASGSADTTVRLWDVTTPAAPTVLPVRLDHHNPVFAVAFSPDGHTLATGAADYAVRLWDVAEPAVAALHGRPLSAHTDTVSGLAFSPDGRTLVSGSRDRTVRTWRLDPTAAVDRICRTTAGALTQSRWTEYISPDLDFAPPCATDPR